MPILENSWKLLNGEREGQPTTMAATQFNRNLSGYIFMWQGNHPTLIFRDNNCFNVVALFFIDLHP